MGPWPPYPGEVGASMGHSWPPGPDKAGGYNHNTATTKTGEGPEAEGAKELAENNESAA